MKIIETLNDENTDNLCIIDIRNATSFSYGHIPNAINLKENEVENFVKTHPEKEFLIYCKDGKNSEKIAKNLENQHFSVSILSGGYFGYLRERSKILMKENVCEKVEVSIRKKFHKELFSRFTKAINTYDLIKPNDKIAVCISGGKDSMLMAKLFQELKHHNKFPFELVFLVMDPGYSKENREVIERNCHMLNIPVQIFETEIFENVFNIEKSPCYICARMRRGYLYSKAKELGCNKIALGHHFDDVIETILMGMLYSGQIQTMMPKLHSTNFEGMELIRPMYLIREEDIQRWRDYNDLYFIQCACKFTDTLAFERDEDSVLSSKRAKVKEIIKSIKKDDPQIEGNIFKSVENVNLSTIIAYKDKQNAVHHFLDDYDK